MMISVLRFTLTIFLQLIICHTGVSSVKVELSPNKPLFRVGDRQELTCRMTQCFGKMTFSWRSLEDQPLFGESHTSSSESTLLFKNVKKNIENKIQCKGTCEGTSTQAAVTVKVYSFAKDPVISGHNVLVLGKENTLTCQVSDVYPAEYMTLEWLRGGEVVHTQEGEYGEESILSYYKFTPQISNTGESIICRATLSLEGLPLTESTRQTKESMTVLCPPVNTVISVSPNNSKEKEFLNISCVSDSSPVGHQVLSKVLDGKETELVSGAGPQVSVSYREANFSHSGVYICKTTTPCGSQTNNVTVTVAAHPLEVSLQPNNSFIPVRRGSSMTLACIVSGCPHAHITWPNVKHQSHLSRKDNQTVVSQLGPWIVGLEDNRTFVCEVECGSVVKSKRTELRVFCPPVNTVISVSPNNPKEKEFLNISCVSDSSPVGHQVLSKVLDGKETELVSGAGPQVSVSYREANFSHSGVYICKTTTPCGRLTNNVTVTVAAHPLEVSLQPNNSFIPVRRGSSMTLTCIISGCPHAHITWPNVKHQSHLSRNGNQTVVSQLGPWIVGLEDNRTFVCEVECGSVVKSKRTELRVFSFSSDPTIESSGPFLEGKVTNLTCTVLEVFPTDSFHLQWLDGEHELHSVHGNFSDKLQNLNLTIPFKPNDSHRNKIFTCKVSLTMEGLSEQKTVSTTKTVQYSPKHTRIDVRPQEELSEGETVTISCQTDSSPEGHVILKRVLNGEETKLVSSNGTQTSFDIFFTTASHSGTYVCEAVNKHGHQRESIQITVQAPPRNMTVTVHPSKEVQEGETVTICCQSVSFPPSHVTLRRLDNGNDIYSSNGTFHLANLTSKDSGTYQVIASNSLGSETENITLKVTGKTGVDKEIYKSLFEILTSVKFIMPVIGVGILGIVVSSLGFIRKAKLKGSYEMSEGNIEIP